MVLEGRAHPVSLLLRIAPVRVKIPSPPAFRASAEGISMTRACLLGTGFAVPDRVVTNHDLARLMDTSDEWIRTRTGIEERRWVREGETSAQLALCAATRALEMAGVTARQLDAI